MKKTISGIEFNYKSIDKDTKEFYLLEENLSIIVTKLGKRTFQGSGIMGTRTHDELAYSVKYSFSEENYKMYSSATADYQKCIRRIVENIKSKP